MGIPWDGISLLGTSRIIPSQLALLSGWFSELPTYGIWTNRSLEEIFPSNTFTTSIELEAPEVFLLGKMKDHCFVWVGKAYFQNLCLLVLRKVMCFWRIHHQPAFFPVGFSREFYESLYPSDFPGNDSKHKQPKLYSWWLQVATHPFWQGIFIPQILDSNLFSPRAEAPQIFGITKHPSVDPFFGGGRVFVLGGSSLNGPEGPSLEQWESLMWGVWLFVSRHFVRHEVVGDLGRNGFGTSGNHTYMQ